VIDVNAAFEALEAKILRRHPRGHGYINIGAIAPAFATC
jgi:hypothetical protein